MFEDRTTEQIKKEALAEINPATGLSSMAGSFADAVIGPAAQRVSELYKALPAVLSMLFVDPTSGRFLDLVGRDYHNLTRREGTKARCAMDLTGKAGTVVPAGTIFLTATGLRFQILSTVTIGTDGRAVCQLEAMEVGAAYNILSGTISGMWVNISGLTGYINQEASGGTDRESGEQLYERIEEARQRPRTSGNGWDFRGWALEVAGVGEAKVVELHDGPGTVGLTLVDSTYAPASDEMVAAALANIMTKKPIGAAPTVQAAQALEITVAATVTIQDTSLDEVKRALEAGLREYLKTLIEAKYGRIYYGPGEDLPYNLIYNRVLAILLNIQGVENFSVLTVNGGTQDIPIPAGSIPVLGEAVMT
ncbi:baseplate J/gp47 family protein [uncultured Intestinimonas sp.]|uniref:baseplate J/gp47 family protein n=1 Tax=uncultured Intestinimonas sp. TaxID=1689265 RepID=UPI0025DEF3AB|nr:baseplate J/gp47 family protein [uncultured Intestinimonas sp.]